MKARKYRWNPCPFCSRGGPLHEDCLERALAGFGIYPHVKLIDGKAEKFYYRKDFEPVWERFGISTKHKEVN